MQTYNPATFAWNWTAGATGLQGTVSAASMSLSPNGLSVSNIAASNAPVCPNGVNGALTTTGCAIGTGGGGLPVNNPAFTGVISGPNVQAQQIGGTFVANAATSGANWCAKVNTEQALAIAAGSNVVDATSLTGTQTCAASLTLSTGITVLVGANTTITLASGNAIFLGANSYLIGQLSLIHI